MKKIIAGILIAVCILAATLQNAGAAAEHVIVKPKVTATPTIAPSSKPTATPTATAKPTATPTATPKPTATPTATPKPTATPTATPKPTATPTAEPTPTPTPAPAESGSGPVKMPELPSRAADLLYNDKAEIDTTYKNDGLITVTYTASTTNAIAVMVVPPGADENKKDERYDYTNVKAGVPYTIPLTSGSGKYVLKICENSSGTSYAVRYTADVDVKLVNDYSPFLYPSDFVKYSKSSAVVKKAADLAGGYTDKYKKIEAVYNFVVKNFTYDKDRAAKITSGELKGYAPVLDDVLAAKKGICYDYAGVMTAMLRSLGVPAKMVFGYAGEKGEYHAWISIYDTDQQKWVEGVIIFDGTTWHRTDPTWISGGMKSDGTVPDSLRKIVTNSSLYKATKAY
ncbi:MAG: transglutaminase domain-containing protein [Oscillospiraceae bacterium]|jgi:transglutaminase-like putative cysteine protease|nr:transglutaminase domain-containing protein [Oscillospiraceae bacterium]